MPEVMFLAIRTRWGTRRLRLALFPITPASTHERTVAAVGAQRLRHTIDRRAAPFRHSGGLASRRDRLDASPGLSRADRRALFRARGAAAGHGRPYRRDHAEPRDRIRREIPNS